MTSTPTPTSTQTQTQTPTISDPGVSLGQDALSACRILRLPEVLRIRGRSRSSHYMDMGRRLFTPPVQLGANCIGWPESEVIALNRARISGMPEQEIQALVEQLNASRKLGKGSGQR